MNSLDILKQELINQKTNFQNKGYSLTCANLNPSPSEITLATSNLPDLNQVNATAEDVALGKTFISSSGTLETGTYQGGGSTTTTDNRYYTLAFNMNEPFEIEIPESTPFSEIRDYAFWTEISGEPLFLKNNLSIPSNITRIGSYAFHGCNGLTGNLYVPSTCAELGQRVFNYCENIAHAYIEGGITQQSFYLFDHCSSLQSIELNNNVTTIPTYFCSYCTSLVSFTIPSSVTAINAYFIRNSTALKTLIFLPSDPPTLNANAFSYSSLPNVYFPYLSYSNYISATNYTKITSNKFAQGIFEASTSLPSSITGYNLTWYASTSDLEAQINPITQTGEAGMYFARPTAQ